MTTFYLSSVDGSNSDDGLSWANAVATLEYAVETLAASGGPHTILVDSAHSESLSGDTFITAAQDLRIISVNRSGSDAPLEGAVIGAQATNYTINFGAAVASVFVYGVTFTAGAGNTAAKDVFTGAINGGHIEYESCRFESNQTSQPSSIYVGGTSGTAHNGFTGFRNCTFKISRSTNRLRGQSNVEMYGCTLETSVATGVFIAYRAGMFRLRAEGCDFSSVGSNALVESTTECTGVYEFANCKIGTGAVLTTAATVLNKGNSIVTLFNCDSGDNHYAFAHYDAFGSTVAQPTIYANDGAKYDGTNGAAWNITTTDNCSFYTPYVSPWFHQYAEAGTVTPTVEIVRDGSATAYQDDEVWGEFSYQGTSSSTKATIVSDRMALLGTPANQTTGDLGASDWTGENATAWFGKLSPGSITINEIGHLSARIVVGEPSITVYADPTIRV